MDSSVFRCLLTISLVLAPLPLCGGGRGEPALDAHAVDVLLKEAQVRGIIEASQAVTLQKLAESMRLPQDDGLGAAEERGGDGSSDSDERTSTFMKVYNHLTLLNVLYLSGAVLTMGAYSLFMTLAVEKLHYGGLSVVMGVQVLAIGAAGIVAWDTVQYAYVGGLLCTICTSTIPFTVYNILRSFKKWPGEDPGHFVDFHVYIRPGWVVMEVATIVVGLGFVGLKGIYFPFLLFPVSFALWYLSMDLSPLIPGWSVFDHTLVRIRVSLVLGIAMVLAGYIFESRLGSDPDMGFWLYLFGIVTFKFAAAVDFPKWDIYGSLFFLTQVGMILVGSHLNRTTFHVFGTIGIIEYVLSLGNSRTALSNSFLLWLMKALVAAALFSQAVKCGGNIEVLAGTVCLIGFNLNFIPFVTSSELYSLFLLATNLGFATIPGMFSRPLDLWFFIVPDIKFVISGITSVLVLVYHLNVLTYTRPNKLTDHLFLLYRAAMSIFISVTFIFLRQPYFAWVGGAGLLVVGACYWEAHILPKPAKAMAAFMAVVYSLYMQSNLLYLVFCVALHIIVMLHMNGSQVEGCVVAVSLVLLSVPLNSKFLIVIGSIYVISYLTYLAYNKFRNSLAFPLVLIVMGLLIIFTGVQYQSVGQQLQESFSSVTPDVVKAVLSSNVHTLWQEGGQFDWYLAVSEARFSWESFAERPLSWVLWSGAFTRALVAGRLLYVTYLCAACIVALVVVAMLLYFREKMIMNVDQRVVIEELKVSLSHDSEHEGHGLVVSIKGTRDKGVAKPVHMALQIPPSRFWMAAENAFGSFPVRMARSMILPFKLTPHLIDLKWMDKKMTSDLSTVQFSAIVLLGTGHKGSRRMKHETATNALSKLKGAGAHDMECLILYKQAWYQPWSKLCSKSVCLANIL